MPRQWIHNCEHGHHEETSSNQNGVSTEEEGCFACEFDLGFFNCPVSLKGNVVIASKDVSVSSLKSNYVANKYNCSSLRGPPMV